ncbi:hypothetical protein J4E86_010464 [Alternaria arbusti]|uniref:uncharacterized protein n=1 Tax=Alternaria arbusti TaxID=232088 RepID=UPI0022203D25|nr:uncharacterized protein J4E86_010464 [Alternaria arbusti]KAI4941431.1 hypothetical protein J4E86_010464 [Alternaria arbusti]
MVPVVPAPGVYFASIRLKTDKPIPYVFGNTSEDTGKKKTQQYTQIKKSFFQIVMREWPSQQYTQIKKSFFQRGETRFDLGGGVEAFKGVFFYRQHTIPAMFHENNDSSVSWGLVLLNARDSIDPT